MSYFFVRHGETNFNLAGLCNDDPAREVHLTPLGIQQAEEAAAVLRTVPLQRIFASPLPRTRETANVINRFHHLPIEIDARLADIRSGFDGLPVQDYQQAIAADRLNLSVNGGESLLQHKQRVTAFLQELVANPEADQLVVAHEETLRVVCGFFQQLPDEIMLDLHIANAEILSFDD